MKYILHLRKNEENKNNENKNEEYPVPPLLTLIEQLSPIETEKLLETFIKFVMDKGNKNDNDGLDNHKLNGIASLWIYALFIRIELPLRADLTANIREFARFCMEERNKLGENETSQLLVFTNIFIVVIEEVFKQPIT